MSFLAFLKNVVMVLSAIVGSPKIPIYYHKKAMKVDYFQCHPFLQSFVIWNHLRILFSSKANKRRRKELRKQVWHGFWQLYRDWFFWTDLIFPNQNFSIRRKFVFFCFFNFSSFFIDSLCITTYNKCNMSSAQNCEFHNFLWF